MAQEMPEPIETGRVYEDTVSGLYVEVVDIWVDEACIPQVRVCQYKGPECKAYQALRRNEISGESYRLSLTAEDIEKRVLNGELKIER